MYAVFFVLHRKQNYGGTVEELGQISIGRDMWVWQESNEMLGTSE